MSALNDTHDEKLRSWVASAEGGDFPIQNLPFGIFRRQGTSEPFRAGVAIGDQIVDIAAALSAGAFDVEAARSASLCHAPHLNALMASGEHGASALRHSLSRSLREGSPLQPRLTACLVPQAHAELAVPAQIGDYTDFYASVHHATRVGKLFRPDNPLMPNYKWLPVAYHGRASSVRASGQRFERPRGQIKGPDDAAPRLAPSRRMDYELELGVFVGPPNKLGESIPLTQAERHVFGVCLLNDWSARDIQAWEYQPLGPFLGKNFATTVSPWVMTLEALEPYRVHWQRAAGDPPVLDYLDSDDNRIRGGIDIQIGAWIQSEHMRAAGVAPVQLSHSSFKYSYWTIAQMVTHHTVNGCNLLAGDLLGTGTQSGPAPEQAGCLLELTEGGKRPIALPGGETRTFLADGDTLILRAWCERPGFARIGFGECAGGVVSPAQG
jgi:fumarylacetoacetase